MTTTVSYPYTAPFQHQVVLPSPEMGDVNTVDYKVLSYQTMSGTFRSYRRTGNRIVLTHSYLTIPVADIRTIRESVINLIIAAAGEDVRLDINAPGLVELWQVKIITMNPQFTNRTRNYYELSLEYEGVRIS